MRQVINPSVCCTGLTQFGHCCTLQIQMELSKSCKYHLSSSLFLNTKTPQILATFLGPRLAFDMALSGGGRSSVCLKNYYKCQKMTKVCLHLVYTSCLFTFYFSKFEEGWGCVLEQLVFFSKILPPFDLKQRRKSLSRV